MTSTANALGGDVPEWELCDGLALSTGDTGTVGLGKTLVNEPKSFPGELWALVKRTLRALWNARGGGLYACGYVVTFAWLEIKRKALHRCQRAEMLRQPTDPQPSRHGRRDVGRELA